MACIEFLRRRRGDRFADGEVPLEICADLIARREMVVAVAGWRYVQLPPDLRRPPWGFASSVALNLSGLDRGRAIPIITLAPAASVRNGAEPPYRQIFEMARQGRHIKAIGNA